MGRSRVDAAGATVGRHGCAMFGLAGPRYQPAFVNSTNDWAGGKAWGQLKYLLPCRTPKAAAIAGNWSCVLATTRRDVNRRGRRQEVVLDVRESAQPSFKRDGARETDQLTVPGHGGEATGGSFCSGPTNS